MGARRIGILLLLAALLAGIVLTIWWPGSGGGPVDSPVATVAVNTPDEVRAGDLTIQQEPSSLENPDAEADDTSFEEGCRSRYAAAERLTAERVESVFRDVAAAIEITSDREQILAAALLNKWGNASHARNLLQSIGGEASSDPMALWALLDLCNQRSNIGCDHAAVAENVRKHHSGNAAFWLSVAGYALKSGDEQDAIQAVRQAISAPGYDNYLADQVMLMERAFATTTDWTFSQRAYFSMDFAASLPPGISPLTDKCKTDNSVEWMDLCEQLADRLQSDGLDMITRSLGTSMKKDVLAARNDEDGIAAIEAQERQMHEQFGYGSGMEAAINAVLNDESLFRAFLQNWDVSGELVAFERLSDDIARLKATEGYDQCNFVANPYVEI